MGSRYLRIDRLMMLWVQGFSLLAHKIGLLVLFVLFDQHLE